MFCLTVETFNINVISLMFTYAVGQITLTCGALIAPIALAQPCLKEIKKIFNSCYS